MKGLLLKDFLVFQKMNKITGMIGTVVLLAFLLFINNEIGFYIANFIVLPLNASTHCSLLSHYDDQWKWKPYMIATPVSAKDIVVSRMLSSYLIFAIQSICVELYNIVFLFINTSFRRDLFMFVVTAALLLSASCVSIFIITDFVLKKERKLASVLQIVLIFLGVGLVYALSKVPLSAIESLFTLSYPLLLCIMSAVFMVILFTAYLVSVPVVRKRF